MNLIIKFFLLKKQKNLSPQWVRTLTLSSFWQRNCFIVLCVCSSIVFLGTREEGRLQRPLTMMHSLVYLTFGFCGLLVTPLSPPVTLSLCFPHLVYLCLGNSAPATLNYLLPWLLQLLLDSELRLPITSPQHMLSAALIVDASCWTLQTLKIPCVTP